MTREKTKRYDYLSCQLDFPLADAVGFAKMFSKEEFHYAICENYKYGIQI